MKESWNMTKLLITLAAVVAVLGLSACNTIEGMGKDISKAGDKIEEAAKKK
jgi:predicted small secreted protein